MHVSRSATLTAHAHSSSSCSLLRCTCCQCLPQLTAIVYVLVVYHQLVEKASCAAVATILQAVALHLLSALVSADPASTALADALHRKDVPRGLLHSVADHAPQILLQPAHKAQVHCLGCLSALHVCWSVLLGNNWLKEGLLAALDCLIFVEYYSSYSSCSTAFDN
jgi:hypothetical protein